MTKSNPITACWDASVLIEYFQDQNPQRMMDIDSVLAEVSNGRCKLIFPTVIYTEVDPSHPKMSAGGRVELQSFFSSIGASSMFALDVRIALKAQEIRRKTNLKTPDAIYVATAIIAKADYLHAFDDAMLALSETPAIDNLRVSACHIKGVVSLPFS